MDNKTDKTVSLNAFFKFFSKHKSISHSLLFHNYLLLLFHMEQLLDLHSKQVKVRLIVLFNVKI